MRTGPPCLWLTLVVGLSGCGEELPSPTVLDLAPRYLGVGVVRVDRELGTASALRAFELELTDLVLAGGTVSGTAGHLQGGPRLRLNGTYDRENAQIRFTGGTGALTSTRSEQVARFGFRPEEGPADGVAADLVGFIDTATVGATTSGRWVAVDPGQALDPPDRSRVSVAPSSRLGYYEVTGAAGASLGGAGVQILRFSLELDVPEAFVVPVRFSGEFIDDLRALPGDVLVLRAQAAGRFSHGIAVPVP